MWRLLRSQVFSGPMCSDQSYIQTSEWTLQLFSFFLLQNHSFTILWVCVLLSFAKNLCDSFISLVVHSLYCKTLWRPVWANCDLWTESWNANNVFWLFSLFGKIHYKIGCKSYFSTNKTCSEKLTAGKSSSESSTLSIVLRELSDSQRLHLVIIHSNTAS